VAIKYRVHFDDQRRRWEVWEDHGSAVAMRHHSWHGTQNEARSAARAQAKQDERDDAVFSDGKTPEEAGRDDAREAMVEPRRMLREIANGCVHDPVLYGPSGIHVCSKCGRGVNILTKQTV
jgi:hypothetical protein